MCNYTLSNIGITQFNHRFLLLANVQLHWRNVEEVEVVGGGLDASVPFLSGLLSEWIMLMIHSAFTFSSLTSVYNASQ